MLFLACLVLGEFLVGLKFEFYMLFVGTYMCIYTCIYIIGLGLDFLVLVYGTPISLAIVLRIKTVGTTIIFSSTWVDDPHRP